MTSSPSRKLSMVVVAVAVAIAACHRGATVSSPSPSGTGAAAAVKATGLPSSMTQALVDSGKALFAAASCAKCHGAGGNGGQNGPKLNDSTWVQIDGSYDAIVNIIHAGVPLANIKGGYRFNMKPMGGGTFTDDQIKMIAAYVYTIGHPK